MGITETLHFKEVDWSTAAGDIMEIRKRVFVIEQRFEKEILCDNRDDNSYHILVTNNNKEPIACGRLCPNGRIGRIAVLMNYRGKGIGTMVLAKLIKIAEKSSIPSLSLNVETDLSPFYDQQKFYADGPVYMKQGVPHQRMTKRLA
ncbi:GNAT family N-acetyltransferase [Aliikangiella coralliicola]|uniref:GNAT family N-acetyltransferase n=1 Tax=Aliikangiella coralliicola TaxID=2592383 RepID=A0A545U4P4_9GAMM|nr:GNAT family N-acetyltransferase [Aliikangiella coralliicola]TQV84439.1 GNAT family N-acetyltransferase [Aliikangiella coralliicola]